jgi:catechol 2,3-dioxygenase-like lactoylglutathione lyase family enzyme
MKLTHVRLLVTDFDACVRFYRDVMGFQVAWGAEGAGYADFRNRGEAMVALFNRQDMAESLGLGHLPSDAPCQDKAVLVFEAADLDSMVEALKARGAQFITELQDRPDWGIRTTHLRDPDGNLIELNSPLLESQWSEEEGQSYTETGQAGDTGTTIGDTDLVQ